VANYHRYPYLPIANASGTTPWLQGLSGQSSIILSDGDFGLYSNVTDQIDALLSANSASEPSDSDYYPLLTNLQWDDDASYPPPEYISQAEVWIQQTDENAYLAQSLTYPPLQQPDDLSFHCSYETNTPTVSEWVSRDFVAASISDACKLFNGITLDGISQKQLILPYPVKVPDGPGAGENLWLSATWNKNDPDCSSHDTLAEDVCTDKLLNVLDDCDTWTTTEKHGGTKVANCIVYGVALQPGPGGGDSTEGPVCNPV
jgi:hypothetical protein